VCIVFVVKLCCLTVVVVVVLLQTENKITLAFVSYSHNNGDVTTFSFHHFPFITHGKTLLAILTLMFPSKQLITTVDINDNSSMITHQLQFIIKTYHHITMTLIVDMNENISMTICPTISPFVIDGNPLTS